ncbi:MAG: acylphosphatase [Dehalococcoidales bacterium]|nr:MAG: acylphosphatase [Dehalococcoidales bacterium]
MNELSAIKVVVHGRVQGVFFRATTRTVARELELSGTVRNLPGWNRVEVHAEGNKAQIEKLIEFLKTGPSGARVEKVDVEWLEYTGGYTGFNVIY